MMAAANNVFVYTGGDQRVPFEVIHAIIDPSVKTVQRGAFAYRRQLVSVIFHDGVEIVEAEAFYNCESLRGIKLLGVREIRDRAFVSCYALSNAEFGDRLESIGIGAFDLCHSLRSIKMPSVRTIRLVAFSNCPHLTEAEFGKKLERMSSNSFHNCPNLQRIAIPLKHNLFTFDMNENRYNQFDGCRNLTTVDIVGADMIHHTISSLLLVRWRDDMKAEFHRINRQLPDTPSREKTDVIQQWIESVINRMEHYKAEHNRYLKEHMTLLELAVWKAKLNAKEDRSIEEGRAKKAKIDTANARNERRITSGADIVIRNVVPFLQLAE